ncbi:MULTISPECIES: hypothetical protein [unclassified Rathayibacter]|jgi:hypothetical protein|uniref:hypothetical protein n=1 Tax=unclassified Rathayibacter TaxID=2609250 RepID=UPI0011B05607|nr:MULTISPECIES: hypothetical protein [unclassified Rathayibacter]
MQLGDTRLVGEERVVELPAVVGLGDSEPHVSEAVDVPGEQLLLALPEGHNVVERRIRMRLRDVVEREGECALVGGVVDQEQRLPGCRGRGYAVLPSLRLAQAPAAVREERGNQVLPTRSELGAVARSRPEVVVLDEPVLQLVGKLAGEKPVGLLPVVSRERIPLCVADALADGSISSGSVEVVEINRDLTSRRGPRSVRTIAERSS